MAALPAISRRNVSDNASFPFLPRYGTSPRNGGSVTYTSLPPLSQYTQPLTEQCRPWGEDALLDGSGFDAKFRSNFDNCHPVPDVSLTHDGFKFPKALYTDLSVFYGAKGATERHVKRPPGFEIFPTHNTQRTHADGQYALTDTTRRALAEGARKLYHTSRYDIMFCNKTESMVAKIRRDAQYNDVCADLGEASKPNLTNCPFCRTSGLNTDFRKKKDRSQAQLTGVNKQNPVLCLGDPDVRFERCTKASCPHTHQCLQTAPERNKISAEESVHVYQEKIIYTIDTSGLKETEEAKPLDGCVQKEDFHSEDFGPWTHDHRLDESEEQFLIPSVYQFKIPSALHCSETENDHLLPFAYRHNPENYCGVPTESYLYPWVSVCRAKAHMPRDGDTATFSPREAQVTPEILPDDPHNRWTSRDENNLRVPCISSLLGSQPKTDAHKWYHQEHPESIPDPRDFVRYGKRVTFNGYNSSVFG